MKTERQTKSDQRPTPSTSPHVDSSRLSSDLLGKPFAYGGRGPIEYDCYGLVMEIYRRRGIELPDFGSSPHATWIHRMIIEGKKLFIELKTPEPFCLVTFTLRPPYTTHIGVVLEDGYRFMHIMQKTEVTIERLDGLLWKKKITGFFKPTMEAGQEST